MQTSIAGVILQLAAAANGKMKVTHSNAKEIEECLKSFCVFNGWESIKDAPPAFWSMPISRIVIGAWTWMTRDQMITLTEASEISHRPLSELTQLIYRGKIGVFPDLGEPNPTKRNRVLLVEWSTRWKIEPFIKRLVISVKPAPTLPAATNSSLNNSYQIVFVPHPLIHLLMPKHQTNRDFSFLPYSQNGIK